MGLGELEIIAIAICFASLQLDMMEGGQFLQNNLSKRVIEYVGGTDGGGYV